MEPLGLEWCCRFGIPPARRSSRVVLVEAQTPSAVVLRPAVKVELGFRV